VHLVGLIYEIIEGLRSTEHKNREILLP